jgi:hypothetical protein
MREAKQFASKKAKWQQMQAVSRWCIGWWQNLLNVQQVELAFFFCLLLTRVIYQVYEAGRRRKISCS